jgi:hypothetical protein
MMGRVRAYLEGDRTPEAVEREAPAPPYMRPPEAPRIVHATVQDAARHPSRTA